jgi:hypothetical protein
MASYFNSLLMHIIIMSSYALKQLTLVGLSKTVILSISTPLAFYPPNFAKLPQLSFSHNNTQFS